MQEEIAQMSPFPQPYTPMVSSLLLNHSSHASLSHPVFVMDPALKSLVSPKGKLSPDHGIIKKLYTIFTLLEMHPHQYELQSMMISIVLQSLLNRSIRDPIQRVPWGDSPVFPPSMKSSSLQSSNKHWTRMNSALDPLFQRSGQSHSALRLKLCFPIFRAKFF